MSSVVLSQVDKFYGKMQALTDVSFEIEHGEFAVFVGPSGCGKSTLLRAIAGLEDIRSGNVLIDNLDVTTAAPSERDVAMVTRTCLCLPIWSSA